MFSYLCGKQQKFTPGNIGRTEIYRKLLGWKRKVEKED